MRNRPVREFRAGRVRLSIWQENLAPADPAYHCSLELNFCDDSGAWRTERSFTYTDLFAVLVVVAHGLAYLSIPSEMDLPKP